MRRPGSLPLPLTLFFLLALSCDAGKEPSSGQAPDTEAAMRVERLLAEMTLDEKIGQMTQVDTTYLLDDDHVRTYHLGSLLCGGDSGPADNRPGGWADMTDHYQALALDGRLGIPLLFGVDAVHGHNNVSGAVIFPHNIGMGCTGDPALVQEAARITALEMTATGAHWTFAPCVAVPRDERWGRTYEGFGETPELAAAMGEAAVRGFQGSNLAYPRGVLACAKHFVGDGGTAGGIDRGDTRMSEEELRRIHLPGYVATIRAGVGTVMASYSSWNGEKLHGHRALLTDLLKDELGFGGFVVSDWAGIEELPGDYAAQIETSIMAGVDMIMVPRTYVRFFRTARQLARDGRIPLARVDDAVRRILRVKVRMGLFEAPFAQRSLLPSVGSAEHRDVARACVRRSLVLLKNDRDLLPLSKDLARIHVAGKSAHDIGLQCGGWTISWQGRAGPITEGTTLLEAIRAAVSAGAEVTYSRNGSGVRGADVCVVAVGEAPYAEYFGDRSDLDLSLPDVLTLLRVRAAGVPVVLVLVSGRPLLLEPVLPYCDAVLAAWLPGTEGGGIADVLFGDHAATGTLSHSWPRDMSQVPINAGNPGYDPLFPLGFGLRFSQPPAGRLAGPSDRNPMLVPRKPGGSQP